MFDEVVVAVGINQDKRGFLSNGKRLEIIRQAIAGMDNVRVIEYDNLTIDTCKSLGIKHIVRGVRNMLDFETERSIADANRRLAPEILPPRNSLTSPPQRCVTSSSTTGTRAPSSRTM